MKPYTVAELLSSAERTFQGAWRFTDSDARGYLFTRQYMGYPKRTAARMFRAELRDHNAELGRSTC